MPGGGLGFGSGFAQGFAGALMTKRARERQQADQESARRDRLFGALLPTMIENAEDWSDVEAAIVAQYPEMAGGKGKPKGDSPLSKVGKLLAPFLGLKRQQPETGRTPPFVPGAGPTIATSTIPQSTQPPGVTGGTLDSVLTRARGAQPAVPSVAPDQPPSPRFQPPAEMPAAFGGGAPFGLLPNDAISAPSFAPPRAGTGAAGLTPPPEAPAPPAPPEQRLFGVRMLSPEQKAERQIRTATAATEAQIAARRSIVQRIGPSLSLTPEEAREFVLTGEFTPAAKRSASTPLLGVDREALALAMYGDRYVNLAMEQQQAVITQEQEMLRKESAARGTGTAEARFNAPIDIPTAQTTGQPVGISAAQVAGQAVPTMAQQDRVTSLTTLKEDLQRIVGAGTPESPGLLGVLPSKNELAGVAPGAVLAARKRMNTYREDIARLQSAIDSIVNVLARTLGEQRGTQTEKDAERAYNAAVQLQAGLLDPFGGDTRESAKVRLDESIANLDRVLANLPKKPVPQAPAGTPAAAAKPASAPASTGAPPIPGAIMRDGKLYINGVPIE